MESVIFILTGAWIKNLLPDGCPYGYVCHRLEQLMQDLVMSDFEGHSSRMDFNGDASQHLPSDSAVLLFAMCFYLKTPGQNFNLFHQEPPKSRNGPIVLMNVAPLSASEYTAFLTAVPSRREKGSHAFILRNKVWTERTSESIITLMLDGKLRANFGGIAGFFEAMTVFLAFHRSRFNNIGGIPFYFMEGLDWVFQDQYST